MFKVLAILALAAVVSAQFGGFEGGYNGGLQGGYGGDHKDFHAYPKYKYEYGVKDGHTGDHKSQWEHRDGDHVKGSYTLEESDGTHRVVEYHDNGHGLDALVKRVGHAKHPYHGESYANLYRHH